jgi:glycosyltransferase involved in cell wall biosynthesis
MYNEAQVVASVVSDLRSAFSRVVCVDDGSSDGSVEAAELAGATVVRHPLNLGQGAALQTGIEYVREMPGAAYVVTFDADGQHAVDDALALVERLRHEPLDVVLGSRFAGTPSPQMPRLRSWVLRAVVRLSPRLRRLGLSDAHNGLRVLRADAARQLQLRLHGMSHASEVLSQVAKHRWTYTEHPVTISYTDYSRAKGQRSYNALNIAFDLAFNRLRAAS